MHNHVHPHQVKIAESDLVHLILIQHLDDHHIRAIDCETHQCCVMTLCSIHADSHEVLITQDSITCMECLLREYEGPTESERKKIRDQVGTQNQGVVCSI